MRARRWAAAADGDGTLRRRVAVRANPQALSHSYFSVNIGSGDFLLADKAACCRWILFWLS
jgi:hypothetical protein